MFRKLPCTNVGIDSTTLKFVRMIDWCLQVESALPHVKGDDMFELFVMPNVDATIGNYRAIPIHREVPNSCSKCTYMPH